MKKLIVLMLSVIVFTNCYAQRRSQRANQTTPAQTETAVPQEAEPTESLVVTEECMMNLSLFNESARNRQFAEALGPWNQVF